MSVGRFVYATTLPIGLWVELPHLYPKACGKSFHVYVVVFFLSMWCSTHNGSFYVGNVGCICMWVLVCAFVWSQNQWFIVHLSGRGVSHIVCSGRCPRLLFCGLGFWGGWLFLVF
jgi:hypothetical protein